MSRLAEVLPKVWPAPDLPGYRPHRKLFATYSAFPYDGLPPLPEALDEGLGWLEADAPKEEWSLRADAEELAKLPAIEATPGLILPRSFTAFLRSPDLQGRIRSATACYIQLEDQVVTTVGAEEGFLIHFLSDQQWCLHWYLHVNRRGEECMLCSSQYYGFRELGEGQPESWRRGPVDPAAEKFAFCAPSFIAFLYRIWIEAEIWFADEDQRPLTEAQRNYAMHYREP